MFTQLFKIRTNSVAFIVSVSLFFTLFQNAYVSYKAWSIITTQTLNDLLFLLTIPMVLFCALNITFSFLLIPYLRKPIIIALIFIYAAINYFMFNHNILINKDLIQHIFETTSSDMPTLNTPNMMMWIFSLAAIPALIILFTKISVIQPWWYGLGMRMANILFSTLLILLMTTLFYKDYAAMFHDNKSIVKLILPSNYIKESISQLNQHSEVANLSLNKMNANI